MTKSLKEPGNTVFFGGLFHLVLGWLHLAPSARSRLSDKSMSPRPSCPLSKSWPMEGSRSSTIPQREDGQFLRLNRRAVWGQERRSRSEIHWAWSKQGSFLWGPPLRNNYRGLSNSRGLLFKEGRSLAISLDKALGKPTLPSDLASNSFIS